MRWRRSFGADNVDERTGPLPDCGDFPLASLHRRGPTRWQRWRAAPPVEPLVEDDAQINHVAQRYRFAVDRPQLRADVLRANDGIKGLV